MVSEYDGFVLTSKLRVHTSNWLAAWIVESSTHETNNSCLLGIKLCRQQVWMQKGLLLQL